MTGGSDSLHQMYNAAFFAILVIVLQFTNATERNLLYILRSAGIMLGTGKQIVQVAWSRGSGSGFFDFLRHITNEISC